MLTKLIIQNFAIIEDIAITFHEGMNVITGETGAGKSLIIDTISLLGGSRSDKDLIRHGASKAYICGEFTTENQELLALLKDLDLLDENRIKIAREIKDNKSTAKVNDKNVNLDTLRLISYYLLDIHVQHDLFKLIDENNYLNYLDDYDEKILKLKNDYLIKRDRYLEEFKTYKDLLNSKKASEDRLEYLVYELNELKSYNLEVDEDIILDQEITKLKNYDKIFQALKESYSYLDNEMFNLDSVYDASRALNKIEDLDSEYKNIKEAINDAYYRLDDAKSKLYDLLSTSEFDEDKFNQMQERSFSLKKLLEKYHKPLNELIEYQNKLSFEIEKITNYDGLVKSLETKLSNLAKKAYDSGLLLRKQRKEASIKLAKELVKECKDLDLADIDFQISFKELLEFNYLDDTAFLPTGLDTIDFLVSFNKGEPAHSLNKVASGGELSRVMLAFKKIFAAKRNLSLIVFDEIDTGVSGEAALMIAKKIHTIAKSTMVISITHMPQVSAISEHNYYVYKEEENNRTKAHIKELNQEEKIYKLAEMLSGRNITESGLAHAKELVELTKKISQ